MSECELCTAVTPAYEVMVITLQLEHFLHHELHLQAPAE